MLKTSTLLEINIDHKEVFVNGQSFQVIDKINFQVNPQEFVTIIGPSGCGKTTLLRLILGLDNDYQGFIKLDDQIVSKPGLDRGIVFQEPRLLPWLSVRDNIEFAIADSCNNRSYAMQEVQKLIDLVGLTGFEKAWPNQLSGGMAQRVALARALVNVPNVLLLDEPFASLDSHTRMLMQGEFLSILSREATATVMVTHDIDEAIFMSDRVIILTQRPATIMADYQVDLEKPRKRNSQDFLNLRSQIIEQFYNAN